MTIEFRLPDLGESTTEGEVVQVLVHEGDTVLKDQPVIELETDKALLEVPSPAAGRITKIHTGPGSKLKVNDVIVTIEEDGAEQTPAKPAEKPTEKKSAAKETPKKKETPVEAKSEPAPSPAPPSEPENEIKDEEGDEEEKIAQEDESEDDAPDEPTLQMPIATVVDVPRGSQVPAAPSTRRLAREMGVDLASVKGTGPGGRISQDDVRAYVKNKMSPPERTGGQSSGPVVISPKLPDFSQWGAIERKPLSNIRKKTMERVSLSWSLIPHVTQVDEADITDLMALRDRHAQSAAEKGGKLTVTVFVLKAVISALKAFPQFNASIDPASEELILKKYYHLGIAVDTEHGLMVPVIRDVDKKDVIELSAELLTISDRARNRKVTLDELRGSTFTITNLGGIGGTAFTPIIQYPEVAILGLARTQKRLEMSKNGIETRQILPLCLSYDHRIVDGADAVRFTRKIAAMLEDPALLLLGT